MIVRRCCLFASGAGLRAQLDEVARRHRAEVEAGRGEVDLPYALRAKMPRAAATLAWHYVFPAARPCADH
jgi:hypothetical protein